MLFGRAFRAAVKKCAASNRAARPARLQILPASFPAGTPPAFRCTMGCGARIEGFLTKVEQPASVSLVGFWYLGLLNWSFKGLAIFWIAYIFFGSAAWASHEVVEGDINSCKAASVRTEDPITRRLRASY